jgi:hypothetical protein
MGVINWKKETYHREKITQTLKRRGLRPDLSNPWEVHGPHEGMNFQMYAGYAINTNDPNDTYCVTIWPGHGVYEIDDPSEWNKTEPGRRLTI